MRPHEALQVALARLRERRGKRLAQRYRQRGEPIDDGQQVRCSRAPCRRLALESGPSQMRLEWYVARKVVKVPAEEVGWGLTAG